MLGVIFDIDSMDEGEFVILFTAQRDNAYRWNRILQIARRANSKGQILQSNGAPISARFLAAMHRDPDGVEGMEAFLAVAIEVGLVVEEDGIFRIVDWARWHKPKSQQTEASAERQAEKRASDRLRAENDALKAALEKALSGKTEIVTPHAVTTCHNPSQDVTPSHNMSQPVTSPPLDVTSVTTHTHTHTLTYTDQENAACSVQSREANENQGLKGRQASRSLMVAGNLTVSELANRYFSDIREHFKAFTPDLQDDALLVRTHHDLTNRRSRWDVCFSEDDVRQGLGLAIRHADALRQAGRCPKLLVSWLVKVASTKYVEQCHEWRMMTARSEEMGFPPPDPPEPDLSELERRR